MKNLAPVLGMLSLAAVPIGIIFLRYSHRIKMCELDLEEKALMSRGAEARLQQLEQRMAAPESGAPARPSLEARAALLEGPAAETSTRPDVPHLKQRG